MARILIADQHSGLQRDLALYLRLLDGGYEVVGEAATSDEAVAQACGCQPEIVLINLDLPQAGGLATVERIRRCHPQTIIVVIGDQLPRDYRDAALQHGANDYVHTLELA